MIAYRGNYLAKPEAITIVAMPMSMNHLSDEQLIRQVKQGDVAAYQILYDRHSAQLLGYCVKILNDQAQAEEILQETFWRVWDSANTFNPKRGSFPSWLYRIARNQAIDLLRQRKVATESLDIQASGEKYLIADHDVAETAVLSLQQEQVHSALADLPPEQQNVIDWIYFQGKTRREIAQDENIPFGTINTRAKLALDKLRRALQVHGYSFEE